MFPNVPTGHGLARQCPLGGAVAKRAGLPSCDRRCERAAGSVAERLAVGHTWGPVDGGEGARPEEGGAGDGDVGERGYLGGVRGGGCISKHCKSRHGAHMLTAKLLQIWFSSHAINCMVPGVVLYVSSDSVVS